VPATSTGADVESLKQISKELRVQIIETLLEAGSGHPGGSLSEIDMLVCLYFGGLLNYRADDPAWPDRDRFILSKGHCTPGFYATLARAGYFPEDWLQTFRKLGSPLQGHPDRTRVPGVEVSTGSLGQGLSVALGMALAARIDGAEWHTFCMLGDGESQEGQVWEAVMAAGNFRVENLIAIIDSTLLRTSSELSNGTRSRSTATTIRRASRRSDPLASGKASPRRSSRTRSRGRASASWRWTTTGTGRRRTPSRRRARSKRSGVRTDG
jgi:transketolase